MKLAQNLYWSKTVNIIIVSILIYTLANIINAALNVVYLIDSYDIFKSPLSIYSQFSLNIRDVNNINYWIILENLFSLITVIGYYIFFIAVSHFSHIQPNRTDYESFLSIKAAYLVLIVAKIADIIPITPTINIIIMTCTIIAYIIMSLGYNNLRKSPTFPENARTGANILYQCTIWTIIASICSAFTIYGSIISIIINSIILFKILSAWYTIKESSPILTQKEDENMARLIPPSYKKDLGYALIVYFLVTVLCKMNSFIYFPAAEQLNDTVPYFFYSYLFFFLPEIITLTVFIVLLFTNNLYLNKWSKLGIIILIFKSLFALANFSSAVYEFFFKTIHLVHTESLLMILSLIGLSLFIWGSLANLKIKITITLYPIVNIIWYALYNYRLNYILNDTFYNSNSFFVLNTIFSIIWFAIILLFLILIGIFTYQWMKPQLRD